MSWSLHLVVKEVNKLNTIIIASGSEVNLAMAAKEELLKEDIDVRVVSMPSMENLNSKMLNIKMRFFHTMLELVYQLKWPVILVGIKMLFRW